MENSASQCHSELTDALLSHPLWQDELCTGGYPGAGVLMDKIISSPIVEDVLMRNDDEFYLNIWWVDGDEEDVVSFQHTDKHRVLLVGMLEILARSVDPIERVVGDSK